jgi:hypothetical protein
MAAQASIAWNITQHDFDRSPRAVQRRSPFKAFTVELVGGYRSGVDHSDAFVPASIWRVLANGRFHMKAPSNELWLWAAVLVGSAGYLGVRVSSSAPRFQIAVAGLAVVLIAVAALLLIRFRWSPELAAALGVFLLLWTLIRMFDGGFTTSKVGMLLSALGILYGYPSLRREVRTPI